MENVKSLIESNQSQAVKRLDAFGSVEMFKESQKMALMLSKSTMVPKVYRENIGDCIIALDLASRMNANVLMVMQNLDIIHGKPSWSSKFIISAINTCGKFSPLRYKFNDKKTECFAYAVELSTGEVLEGSTVSLEMAKKEGWSTKSGSKWITMPEQMLRYRAASFFGRVYAPELTMGLMTTEEAFDLEIEPDNVQDLIGSELFDDIQKEDETTEEPATKKEAAKLPDCEF